MGSKALQNTLQGVLPVCSCISTHRNLTAAKLNHLGMKIATQESWLPPTPTQSPASFSLHPDLTTATRRYTGSQHQIHILSPPPVRGRWSLTMQRECVIRPPLPLAYIPGSASPPSYPSHEHLRGVGAWTVPGWHGPGGPAAQPQLLPASALAISREGAASRLLESTQRRQLRFTHAGAGSYGDAESIIIKGGAQQLELREVSGAACLGKPGCGREQGWRPGLSSPRVQFLNPSAPLRAPSSPSAAHRGVPGAPDGPACTSQKGVQGFGSNVYDPAANLPSTGLHTPTLPTIPIRHGGRRSHSDKASCSSRMGSPCSHTQLSFCIALQKLFQSQGHYAYATTSSNASKTPVCPHCPCLSQTHSPTPGTLGCTGGSRAFLLGKHTAAVHALQPDLTACSTRT